ncbi:MAG: DUF2339 domain-containing protein [Methylotenera sp.]|uniref:DUF2339 domain-containing protein n=1 Tax=Methylotenera sp. TaxID=2051956 RepID=UPI002489A7BA|nr:DUF2339 domain-containing protein [Methylotenera sp.]MDI1308790.1 DUF2339 domain-containing protein [Methylotenera sp.]
MESLFLMLGLLGIVIAIGGIAGFLSLFTSNNKDAKIREVERETNKLNIEITRLSTRLDALKKIVESQQQNIMLPVAALKTETPTLVINPVNVLNADTIPMAKETNSTAAETIADSSLNEQVLASVNPSIQTANVQSTPKEPISPSSTGHAPRTITRPPIKPAEPNFIEKGITAAKDWLFGGNTLVRSGIVILFIGISFLLKLAVDNGFIPIELRLAAVALGGIALLVIGWRLRDKRTEYSWALQGGGIGVLYLTIFAALKLYLLIPAGAAFPLLVAIAFLSAFIAVKQSAMPLAVLGFAGGFLAPVLTSTGHGSHVGLFSYYLVLNLAIAYVAFHKSWRPLNVLGWAFTFIIGTLWGAKSYVPDNFATTEPFLIIFFLLYTGIAVLFAHRQAAKASDYVDATLVFGTPLVAFSLQYALLRDSHFGLAYSALALGVFYIGLAWWVFKRKLETLKFLGECFLALGIGFITLTLPLALDGRWTSAAWAVEGVGLLWVGLRQNRTFPTLSGLALQILAALAFIKGWGLTGYTGVTNQNMYLGVAFIALSGWACGALWNKLRPEKFSLLTTILALWGWLWWVSSGLTAIDELLASNYFMHASLAFIAITSVLLPFVSRFFRWEKLTKLSLLLMPAMAISLLWELFLAAFDSKHPFAYYGAYSWLGSFAAYIWLIKRDHIPNGSFLRAPLLWIGAIIGVMEWQYQLGLYVQESNVWKDIGWAIIPIAIVLGITRWQFASKSTLTSVQLSSARNWAWIGCVPMVASLIAWFMFMSLNSSGNAAPLPYVPLINPLDITLGAVLLMLFIWHRGVNKHLGKLLNMMPVIPGIMGFTLLNGVLLRTLHHWVGTPFEWVSIFNNSTVQMSFTFLWGITAFALMLLAHKRGQRQIWIVGAALMGLVVAKLFLLDLSQHGSVERIASFIGAGVMLLVMGYFAPLPPATKDVANADSIAGLKTETI